jgi:hypothetical protein
MGSEAGQNIGISQFGEIFDDSLMAHAVTQHLQHIFNRDAGAFNARLAEADGGIERYAGGELCHITPASASIHKALGYRGRL